MKFSWPLLVKELRDAMLELVSFEGEDADHVADLAGYFRETMHSTDTYHPFDADYDLDKAFTKYPDGHCNYRSLKSYWAHKRGREEVTYAIADYLGEMIYRIEDHFNDPWNFPPGYKKPKKINFGDVSTKAEMIVTKTILKVRTK